MIRRAQRFETLIVTLYSFSLPLLPAPMVVGCLDFQRDLPNPSTNLRVALCFFLRPASSTMTFSFLKYFCIFFPDSHMHQLF